MTFPHQRMPLHITGLYLVSVASVMALFHFSLVAADIEVILDASNMTVEEFDDLPAYFGPKIPDDGISGVVVYANPAEACDAIYPPPQNLSGSGLEWIVLIRRARCTFSQKVYNAQKAGYAAAIVHNVGSNNLEPMGPDFDRDIQIPSVFVGQDAGVAIRQKYTYGKGFIVHITNEVPDIYWYINLDKYMIPFASVLAFCFLATVVTLIVKCIKDRRRRMRHRLSPHLLKKLPIKKYKKGDQYDVCVICLEEYVEGEKLRELPCSHVYHTKCIDPWLTGSRRTCPICKRKVLSEGRKTRNSDSDCDSGDSDEEVSERTPLLRSGQNQQPTSYGGSEPSIGSDTASSQSGASSSQSEDPASAEQPQQRSRFRSYFSMIQGLIRSNERNAAASPNPNEVNGSRSQTHTNPSSANMSLVSSGNLSVNGSTADFSQLPIGAVGIVPEEATLCVGSLPCGGARKKYQSHRHICGASPRPSTSAGSSLPTSVEVAVDIAQPHSSNSKPCRKESPHKQTGMVV